MSSQYLERYAEAEARQQLAVKLDRRYHHCLVIPAYREAPKLADTFDQLLTRHSDLLLILVLNQPDNEPDLAVNDGLRCALKNMTQRRQLLLLEREAALPRREGVGLARKIGSDVACALMHSGQLREGWIHCTDADASLPVDYFSAADSIADQSASGVIAHPFQHQLAGEMGTAMALYELRLHDHVLALLAAGSPYAFHTLGSCISIRRSVYEQVRGFPRRAGGEDFYLLNKAAKLTKIASPVGPAINIEGRVSSRVPFGTGPALLKLQQLDDPLDAPLFYHPQSYAALKQLLSAVEHQQSLATALNEYPSALSVLTALGIDAALTHCDRQSSDHATYLRHFHQWFDGFRTLKFMHGHRDKGYPDQTFRERYSDITPLSPLSPLGALQQSRAALGWRD